MSLASTTKSGFYSVKNFLSKNETPILTVVGNLLIIGGFALGIKAGAEIEPELKTRKENVDKFKEIYDDYQTTDGDTYDEKSLNKDIFRTNKKCAINVAKILAPAVIAEGVGLFCVDKAVAHEHDKFKTAVKWGTGIAMSFAGYRKKVRDELGEDMDKHFLYGISKEEKDVTMVTVDENGNEVETQEKCHVVENPWNISPYGMIWSPETTTRYQSDEYYLKDFMANTAHYYQDILAIKNKITVNEIKSYIGAKPKEIKLNGQAAGWREGDTIEIYVIKVAIPIGDGKYKPGFVIDFNAHWILDEYPDTGFEMPEADEDDFVAIA